MAPERSPIHSCPDCLDELLAWEGASFTETPIEWVTTLKHSLEDAAQAAQNGCPFFVWLIQATEDWEMTPEERSRASVDFIMRHDLDNLGDVYRCDVIISGLDQGWRPVEKFSVVSDCEDPSAETAYYRTVEGSTSSAASIAQVRRRLKECTTRHYNCIVNPPQSPVRPRRFIVLDDRDRSVVRISSPHDPACSNEVYVALSYCWGVPQPVLTTRATAAAHEKGICVDDLPQTIQDAIWVTRQVGIRLLWVDGLCIVQDDEETVQAEVSSMLHYYQGAFFTITASIASKCTEGFLREPSNSQSRGPGPFYFSLGHPDTKVKLVRTQTKELYPTDRRAWILQESVLSTRIVSFRDGYTGWECRQSSQANPSGRLYMLDKIWGRHVARTWGAVHAPRTWYEIVRDYTSRRLSDPADRLPALSGIATKWAELSKTTAEAYTAGVWLGQFSSLALLWKPAKDEEQADSRFPIFVAPSWSWASFPRTVVYGIPEKAFAPAGSYQQTRKRRRKLEEFAQMAGISSELALDLVNDVVDVSTVQAMNVQGSVLTEHSLEDLLEEWDRFDERRNARPWPSSIRDIQIEPINNQAPFGSIKYGHLILEGQTFQMTDSMQNHLKFEFDYKSDADSRSDKTRICIMMLGWDEPYEIPEYVGSIPRGLILEEESADSNRYRRVGLFYLPDGTDVIEPTITTQTITVEIV